MQLINKKIGDLYVWIGAGSEVLLFNQNLRGSRASVLFVGLSMATITSKPPGVFMRPACLHAAAAWCSCASFPTSPAMTSTPMNVRGVQMKLRKLFNS